MELVAPFHFFFSRLQAYTQISVHSVHKSAVHLYWPSMFCVYSVNKYRTERECTGKGILHLNTKFISFLSYYARLKEVSKKTKNRKYSEIRTLWSLQGSL